MEVSVNTSTLANRDSMSSYLTAASEIPRDPFDFISAYKDEKQLRQIQKRTKKSNVGKRVAEYHEKQNKLILDLLKPMEEHTTDAHDEKEAARLPVQIAIYASLIANFSLCILQMYAAISALSLSLLATGIDSVFDIGSNILLFYLHRRAAKLDKTKWPVGGARLETIGNIIYGFLMGSVNLVVIVESVQSILTHTSGETKDFHLPSILSVAAALGVKLMLFIYCYSIRKYSSQVQVLWEDHRNDLWINTFGVLMSTGGSKLRWWLDPSGAIIIAVGIVFAWSRTIYSQFCLLAGKSAPNEFIQLLVYKTMTYSKDIQKVDTVRAYHSGPGYFVEIDIVMSPNTPLSRAHDLSQRLQDEIEVLPNVERAFVHVDHEATHLPEHRKSI
ncbi:CDF-like metal transporter [Dendrothele bispora CBS 962.96]|uniref:CDF-like metal transporter n=1 Tax=Dendrothele bispora (strain CBS 962.96) TaxID=1314807 RepID=A0A4S8LA93_DENBC|nr:CDF-like metal transporter [Dendrothele bispora CBS 962.96]